MGVGHRGKAGTEKKRRPTILFVRSVALTSALMLAGASVAAPTNTKRTEPPKPTRSMRVVVVTDSRTGCEPSCAQWIAAHGEITNDTPAQFQRVFKAPGQKQLPVFISSPGGSVPAALAIGREIRKRGLDVAVERTVFHKCEQTSTPCDLRALKDAEKGRPEPIALNALPLASSSWRPAPSAWCRSTALSAFTSTTPS